MKKGLVLEGGAMRGMFTAGVLDVMMENELHFDGAVGVSAGAAFGCNFKSHQIGRAIRYNKKYCKDYRYCSIRSWLTTGDLFGAKFCYEELPLHLDPFDRETYQADPMEFYAVATDVLTGEPVYHNCVTGDGEDLQWFRASGSMPVVSKPVRIGDCEYLDGGISDSIPIHFFQDLGYEKNVVVLTQPSDYRKQPMKYAGLIRFALRKYPEIAEKMLCRHLSYTSQQQYIAAEEKKGSVLVIRPEKDLEIGRISHDPSELESVYQTGRAVCQEMLPQIQAFLL